MAWIRGITLEDIGSLHLGKSLGFELHGVWSYYDPQTQRRLIVGFTDAGEVMEQLKYEGAPYEDVTLEWKR